jgi:peptidoglycan/LPS O-acetylase OafA/YrhL
MAIALVMIFHLLKFVGDHPAATLLQGVTNAGSVGVDLFFVLSGLLITGELLQTKGRPRYFRNFYARRWRRP